MQKLLDSTVAATRRIAADLRPLMLDDLGLLAALEWLTQDFMRRTQVHCNLQVDNAIAQVDTSIQSALYRAVQEMLTNVTRYAQASQVHIMLALHNSLVRLQVRDDGRGMDAAEQTKRGSFGLIGMRERIYTLGGTVAIESQPGKGTKIMIELPLSPFSSQAAPQGGHA
jgi:two-component system, NarL family, sensor histidine kinase UhpB